MAVNGRKIREQVLALLARKDYRPLNKVDIARKLGLAANERVALRKTHRELERAGEIARTIPSSAHCKGRGTFTMLCPMIPDSYMTFTRALSEISSREHPRMLATKSWFASMCGSPATLIRKGK